MKYFFFSIVTVFLFYLYLCNEINPTKNETEDPSIKLADLEEKLGKTESKMEDSPEEIQKKRDEKDKKLKEQIKQILKEFGLENSKTLTREQMKNIFIKMIDNSLKENEENEEDKKIDNSGLMKGLLNLIFDNLISKDNEIIEVDKIGDFFEPQNILNSLKVLLQKLNMESLIDIFSGPLLDTFGNKSNTDSNSENNTNSNNFNNTNNTNTNIKEEKNSEL